MSAAAPLAVITAAGASRRMGRPKALLAWDGRSLLAVMTDVLRRAGFGRCAVVVGAHRGPVSDEAHRLGVMPVDNPRWRDGRFTSIRTAARWAAGIAQDPWLLLWPADCPGVAAATLERLREATMRFPDASLVPRHGGRCGHPVLVGPSLVRRIAALEDGNLRELLRLAPGGRREIPVDDPAVLDNLNTPDDFARFLARCAGAGRPVAGAGHA